MFRAIRKNFNETLLSHFFLILLISEFVTKVFIIHSSNPLRFSTYTKLFYGCFFFYFIIKNKLYKHKILKYIYVLAFVFALGQLFFLFDSTFTTTDLLNNLFTFSTYIFLPLFVVCVENENAKKITRSNISAIKSTALLNVVIIGISLIIPFEIFRSYPISQRFGFNGILGFSSSASFFYIAVISVYFVIAYVNPTKKNLGLLCLQCVTAILVGTKTIWFFLFIVAVAYFCFLINGKIKNIFRLLLLLAIIVYFVFKEKIEKFIVSLFSFGEYYYNEYGFLTVILSTRDLYFKEVYGYYISNFSLPTFLFGGINVFEIRVEFEFINMLVFYGLVGTLIYLLLIKYIFYNTHQKPIKTAIFVALILTCALSGGFFYSVFSACIFYLAYRYLDLIINNERTKE